MTLANLGISALYASAVTGILLVLSALGANWHQLQCLAAALTVGIGFGLQEIVANFFSGIIILFERPTEGPHTTPHTWFDRIATMATLVNGRQGI